jgi:formamidopyrimidine-DNA glycosylase
MPELPEVETVRRGLAPVMVGARFETIDQRRPDLRFPFPADFALRLQGRRIDSLARRAKYLLADLDDGEVLVMHLGMSGSFRIEAKPGEPGDAEALSTYYYDTSKDPVHDHVVFELSSGARIIYNDPRRFGFMQLIPRRVLAEHALFKNVGIEPLGNSKARPRLSRRRFSIRRSLRGSAIFMSAKLCIALGFRQGGPPVRSCARTAVRHRARICWHASSAKFWKRRSRRAARLYAIIV